MGWLSILAWRALNRFLLLLPLKLTKVEPQALFIIYLALKLKGTVPRDFRLQSFFHESVSPKPLSIPLWPFRIFSKIRRDIRSSRCTTGVVDVANGKNLQSEKSEKFKLFFYCGCEFLREDPNVIFRGLGEDDS